MPTFFCNITWMKNYNGRIDSDPPLGGGDFPEKHGYCNEECNFVKCADGFVYGHFEVSKNNIIRQVNIERLGAEKNSPFVDGIDVVWTAPRKGLDPRVVVGWYKNARIYRNRQEFNGFASPLHREAKLIQYNVRAKHEDAVLIQSDKRDLELRRGQRGWSGQASWWYADQTQNAEARAFVAKVREIMELTSFISFNTQENDRNPPPGSRAGAAAQESYIRYLREYEVQIHPRHSNLQKKFEKFLKEINPDTKFLPTYRDDLRYENARCGKVMVEVKPADADSIRFAIRTAIGQLCDYKQNRGWTDRQLIVVESEVKSEDDKRLALDNKFGLAWPVEGGNFEVIWPD